MRTPINVTLTAAALCLLSTPALAGPSTDIGVDILTPASELVYDASAIDILVENTSNRRANDVVLSVSLPETNTSPTVHVMGSLSAVDPACVQTGTQLSCALGRLDAGDSVVVSFDIALPQADQVLEIAASVSTSSTDNNAANDSDTEVPALDNYAVSVSPGDVATNRHCTGQGLTS
ncbi:MAG: hypothetical protein KDK70_44230, partial [Myxococcales bacterium]|nr:hypothetical protein [Myxococcales bacterium]